ncbi:hypothetical protein SCHPADRAFT_924424 [Schizopora paradoxa]|uniref:BTB domain-containing protein n=1 Tax=Schizopora paradoxa TaxID=27342 RepID=A0A0H2SCP1_9AGAM|nr:hypothetical protein SCHPADRAFT_924424 [Schizopora paradoxa]
MKMAMDLNTVQKSLEDLQSNHSSVSDSSTISPSTTPSSPSTESLPQYHPSFSFEDADLILSSADSTLFRVPSITLKMASGFFRSTMTLPQNTHKDDPNGSDTHSEIIHLSESSKLLETLLSIVCCLGVNPVSAFATFEDVSDLLFAAEKYEMPGVTSYMRTVIVGPRFLADPLRVYALSCRYGWPPEAKLSSRLTLSLDLTQQKYRPTLDSLQGAHLMALLSLRHQRKTQLRTALDRFPASRTPYKCQRCYSVVDVHPWREFKWLILDEMDRQPSGETIKTQAFADTPVARQVFAVTCNGDQCHRACFDKDSTLDNISKAIDGLPSSI